MKTLWVDVETTGLDPVKNGIIQIGALVEIDGEVVEEYSERFQPFMGDEISQKALEVNGTTETEVRTHPLIARVAYSEFVALVRKYATAWVLVVGIGTWLEGRTWKT